MMTGKKTSTKKTSKSRKAKSSHRKTMVKEIKEMKNVSTVSAQSLREGFLARENGKLSVSSLENASPAALNAEIVDSLPDARHAEIVNVLNAEIADGMERLARLLSGNHRAADRIQVHEALNGSVYRDLTRPSRFELQIVYFDTDPVGIDQFSRVMKKIFGFGSPIR
jgi:hypothetical protein